MQDDIQQQILGAFLIALRPLARMLLRFGIGFREFSEVAKTAFVDVATNDYGIRGRPTNISRVAVMTGLTRKEVRRVRQQIDLGNHVVIVKSTPLSEILHRWHSDSKFLDESGRPANLSFAGEGNTFSGLVKKYGGDIPVGAMRAELKRVGAVVEDDSGGLRVVSRALHPEGYHDKLITAVVHAIYPLIATVAHNVNPNRQDDSWAQFTTYSQTIRQSTLPRLRRISFDRLSHLAESIDDLLVAYEALDEQDELEGERSTVAVSVFYFEERDERAGDYW
jgi:hypothetical protein